MKRWILLFAAVLVWVPTLSSAAPATPGGYVSGFLGVNVARDRNVFTSSGSGNFNDRVEFDPGISVGGTGGYDFGMVRLEGELSYKHAEIKSIVNQDTGFRYRNVDGELGVFAVMFNGFVDLHNDSPVTPYLGGGIGFATLRLGDTRGVDNTNTRVILYDEADDTVFAYQVGAGLDIAINRRFSLDLGYRYFVADQARFESDFATTNMRYQSHNGTVGFKVKF